MDEMKWRKDEIFIALKRADELSHDGVTIGLDFLEICKWRRMERRRSFANDRAFITVQSLRRGA